MIASPRKMEWCQYQILVCPQNRKAEHWICGHLSRKNGFPPTVLGCWLDKHDYQRGVTAERMLVLPKNRRNEHQYSEYLQSPQQHANGE